MKKIKCEQCGLYYKDRGEEDFKTGSGYVRSLCWKCGFLWKIIGYSISSVSEFAKSRNREVLIRLGDIKIRKIRSNKVILK